MLPRTLRNDRGIALVATLMLLVAFTALAGAAAMSVVTESNVTTHHKVGNQALYSADSGVEAAKQFMTDWAESKMDSLNQVWAGNGPIIPDPSVIFPAAGLEFESNVAPLFNAKTTLVFEDSSLQYQSQIYDYRYTTVADGQFAGGARRVVSEGSLRISATRGSFADYLIFTDTHQQPDGEDVWFHSSGNFDGRVHTNGTMRFAYYPTFQDMATQVDDKAYFYNNGNNKYLDDDHNGSKDVPDFYGGFERGVDRIDLPGNAFSQQRASLGGNPANTRPLSNGEIRALLGMPPSNKSVPRGVYLASDNGKIEGGIFVQGKAKNVNMRTEGTKQVYEITDNSNQVTTVKVDRDKNKTEWIKPDGHNEVLDGTPNGVLFVRGAVESLSGGGRDENGIQPALADGSQVNIVTTGDIVIDGDLTYNDFEAGESVLGLFSSKGDVRISEHAPNDIQLNAYVMASADGKVFTVDNWDSGSYRGEVHLTGGMITNYYGAFGTFGENMSGYGRDFHYDGRGFVPPYFPLTQRFVTDRPAPQVLSWREEMPLP